MEMNDTTSLPAILTRAAYFERNDELALSAGLYELALKSNPTDEKILKRLMMIYRRMKKYEKEIQIIDRTIKIQMKNKTSKGPRGIIYKLLFGKFDSKNAGRVNDLINDLSRRKQLLLSKVI